MSSKVIILQIYNNRERKYSLVPNISAMCTDRRVFYLVFVEHSTRENKIFIKEIRVCYVATKNSDEVPYLTYFL